MADTPLGKAVKDHVHDPARTVALGMHGDGAATHRTYGLFTLSWNPLHGHGSTNQTRFIFTVIKKSDLADGTLEQVFDRLAWSMNCLLEGKISARDWKGRKTPKRGASSRKGWKAAMVQLRGIGSSTAPAWGSRP